MRSRAIISDNNNLPEFNVINHHHHHQQQQQQQPLIRLNTISQNHPTSPSIQPPAIQASVSITAGNSQTNLANVTGNDFSVQDINLPGMQITLRPLNMTPSNNTSPNATTQNNHFSNYQQNSNSLSNIASINLIVDNQPLNHNYVSLPNNMSRPIFTRTSLHHHHHHHPPTSPSHLEQMVTQNAVNMAIRHFQRSDPTLNINNPIHSNRFPAVQPNPDNNISPVTISTHLTNQPGPIQPHPPIPPIPVPDLASIFSFNRHDLQNLHFRIPARIHLLDRSLEVN
jgi:hypothetical protein